MGRRPIGRKAMTPAQRQKRYRRNLRPDRTKLKQEARRAREAGARRGDVKGILGPRQQALWRHLRGSAVALGAMVARDRDGSRGRQPLPDDAARPDKAVRVPAGKNCVLFLWAIASMLPEALAVIEAWGFVYQTSYAWKKPRQITGYWARFVHEYLLIATRGTVPAPAPGAQWSSMFEPLVIEAAAAEHSEKPEAVAEMIEQYFPTTPKLEMFARGPARPGWDAWGNQIDVPLEGRARTEVSTGSGRNPTAGGRRRVRGAALEEKA